MLLPVYAFFPTNSRRLPLQPWSLFQPLHNMLDMYSPPSTRALPPCFLHLLDRLPVSAALQPGSRCRPHSTTCCLPLLAGRDKIM